MGKKNAEEWEAARKRHRLSKVQAQMARELGMNPKKLGKIDNHRQEPWKAPLPQFIEGLYFKRFDKHPSDVVLKNASVKVGSANKRSGQTSTA